MLFPNPVQNLPTPFSMLLLTPSSSSSPSSPKPFPNTLESAIDPCLDPSLTPPPSSSSSLNWTRKYMGVCVMGCWVWGLSKLFLHPPFSLLLRDRVKYADSGVRVGDGDAEYVVFGVLGLGVLGDRVFLAISSSSLTSASSPSTSPSLALLLLAASGVGHTG